jgi:hypothetical protein
VDVFEQAGEVAAQRLRQLGYETDTAGQAVDAAGSEAANRILHRANLKLAAAWYAWTLSQSERDQRTVAAHAAAMLGIPGHASVLSGILGRWGEALARLRGRS